MNDDAQPESAGHQGHFEISRIWAVLIVSMSTRWADDFLAATHQTGFSWGNHRPSRITLL